MKSFRLFSLTTLNNFFPIRFHAGLSKWTPNNVNLRRTTEIILVNFSLVLLPTMIQRGFHILFLVSIFIGVVLSLDLGEKAKCQWHWLQKSLVSGEQCVIRSNNAPGVCTVISSCAPVWDLYERGMIRTNPPTVCKVSERSVCCPRADVKVETSTQTARKIRISEKSNQSMTALTPLNALFVCRMSWLCSKRL